MNPAFLIVSPISVQIAQLVYKSGVKDMLLSWMCQAYMHRLNVLHMWSRSDAFLEALGIVLQAINYVHACAAIPAFPRSSRFSMHMYSSCVAHHQDIRTVMADGVGKVPNCDWSGLSGTNN